MGDLKNRLSELLRKPIWTEEESKWMLKYLDDSSASELKDLLQRHFEEDKAQALLPADLSKQVLLNIHQRLGVDNKTPKAPVVKMWLLRIAVAASIIAVIALSWNIFL